MLWQARVPRSGENTRVGPRTRAAREGWRVCALQHCWRQPTNRSDEKHIHTRGASRWTGRDADAPRHPSTTTTECAPPFSLVSLTSAKSRPSQHTRSYGLLSERGLRAAAVRTGPEPDFLASVFLAGWRGLALRNDGQNEKANLWLRRLILILGEPRRMTTEIVFAP